ncbi:MAG: alkaline phosphatase D family protein [Thermoleophilia bacterium]|nr:alkaline phosphatase D family protein [Thermoleophilia bacterium]
MLRVVVVVLALSAAAGGALSGLAPGAAPGFAEGVAAGEVGPTEALLWTRAPRTGALRLELSANARFRGLPIVRQARARAADDRTVRVPVAALKPGTRYWYRFRQGTSVSPVGTFVTAPGPTTAARVRFAVSGDADATPGANGRPAYNRYETYGRMARERNDFNINLGDTIYSDSEVGGAAVARTIPAKWEKYRLGLALPALRQLRAAAGLYSHWDDHEFVNDFSRAEHGDAIYRAGVKAFSDYAPVRYSPTTGLYRTFRWGRLLELFFLDERSFRSAKATAPCGNDLAPTAPAAVRAGFGAIAPDLAKPVPQACLDTIDDPERTMLGAAQEAAFVKAVRASTATFKVIVNEVPLLQMYALPYDRWEGYAAARTRILDVLEGLQGVVVLTTDTHAHLIGEIRRSTLEPGGPVGTGIFEVVTGPVATNTYGKEIDGFLGAPGAGALVTGLFFKPPPPSGLGLTCAATDTYGYAEVEVTAARLTVTPKTAAGGRVVDATGRPCAPLVVRPS